MATENKILDLSFPAAEDLSKDQYRWMVLTATGVRRPDSETEVLIGILQNAPAAGEAAQVRVIGQSKLEMNGALGVGSFVKAEFVDAADAGKGKDAAAALAYARAIVMEASENEDELASVLLIGPLPAITQIAWQRATITTDATAGPNIWSAAELIGGLLLRDPNGASRNDVSPTAAQIVEAIPGAIVGSSFEFTVKNTADADETITLTAGAGVTLNGTMTIPRYHSRRFLAVCTNVGAGTEAVTIYDLGDMPRASVPALFACVFAGDHTTTGGNAAEDIEVAGTLGTDVAIVTIQDNGSNNVTLLQSVAAVDKITCTFSGDPGADCIVNYMVLRAVS